MIQCTIQITLVNEGYFFPSFWMMPSDSGLSELPWLKKIPSFHFTLSSQGRFYTDLSRRINKTYLYQVDATPMNCHNSRTSFGASLGLYWNFIPALLLCLIMPFFCPSLYNGDPKALFNKPPPAH